MSSNEKHHGGLTLVEAVETLSNIAEMEWDHSLGVAQNRFVALQGEKIPYRTVQWLHRRNAKETLEIVKDVFKVVLNYLKHFYKNDYSLVTDSKTLDGIKTIMVLVGEAAKKIDRYTKLFHEKHPQSVTDLKEYKQLQEFYVRKISRNIDEGVLGRWILALTQRALKEKKVKLVARKIPEIKHVFVDLESVKKDTEYELFLIRKEDGTRFFSPRLIRNIKLICDFGKYFGKEVEKEPLLDLPIWRDKEAENNAKWILKIATRELEVFYKEAFSFKNKELVGMINKAVMALMMASNPHHLISANATKTCCEYFKDFQIYLREALNAKDYQKLLAYPPKSNGTDRAILQLTHCLCKGLFTSQCSLKDCKEFIHSSLEEGRKAHSKEHELASKKSGAIWCRVGADYSALQKILRSHSSGPLDLLLQEFEVGNYTFFDPYFQGNTGCLLYTINENGKKIKNLRLPCPTHQEFIHKAEIIPEFKGFLRSLNKESKYLIINFQDRTSWKEHARSQTLEELEKVPEFSKHLTIMTLPKDTEFYHQVAPYSEDHQVVTFLAHLKEHFKDPLSGYHLPKEIEKVLNSHWLDGIIENTHKIFFSGKNVLTREARLDFIEIINLFILLRAIDIIKPDFLSLCCKDAVDTSMTQNVLFYSFLKLITGKEITEEEYGLIDLILYGPSFIYRKRSVNSDRFNRMLSALKTIEAVKNEVGAKNFPNVIEKAYHSFYQMKLSNFKISKE